MTVELLLDALFQFGADPGFGFGNHEEILRFRNITTLLTHNIIDNLELVIDEKLQITSDHKELSDFFVKYAELLGEEIEQFDFSEDILLQIYHFTTPAKLFHDYQTALSNIVKVFKFEVYKSESVLVSEGDESKKLFLTYQDHFKMLKHLINFAFLKLLEILENCINANFIPQITSEDIRNIFLKLKLFEDCLKGKIYQIVNKTIEIIEKNYFYDDYDDDDYDEDYSDQDYPTIARRVRIRRGDRTTRINGDKYEESTIRSLENVDSQEAISKSLDQDFFSHY